MPGDFPKNVSLKSGPNHKKKKKERKRTELENQISYTFGS